MTCGYCGKPGGWETHQQCIKQALEEMDRLGLIHLIAADKGKTVTSFQEAFWSKLHNEWESARTHIHVDETVDEDFITLFAVMRATRNFLPPNYSQEKAFYYAGSIFNTLMGAKYGSPVPETKKFHNRVKELVEEVKSVPVDKATFDFLSRHTAKMK